MNQKISKKIVAVLMIFVFMFTNFGYSISAIATSDGFQVITNGFFQKDEIEFSAYFDEDGKETESISNVNQNVSLRLKISPQVDGYLKSASIVAVPSTGSDINFKIKSIQTITNDLDEAEENLNKLVTLETEKETEEETTQTTNEVVETEEEQEVVENTESTENIVTETSSTEESNANVTESTELSGGGSSSDIVNGVGETKVITGSTANTVDANNVAENTVVEENTTTSNSTVITNNIVEENTTSTNTSVENSITDEQSTIENTVTNEVTLDDNMNVVEETIITPDTIDTVEESEEEDVLIDEEQVIEEKSSEGQDEETIIATNLTSDVNIVSDNEISLENIIKETYIILELEFSAGESFNVADLYKEINLQLSGTYINADLEEVAVAKESTVTVGWEYTKDISISSEYTKVSPFDIADTTGTIVENKITVTRNITDEKYLPLKETTVDVTVPTFNGKLPIDVNVYASKLMATKGEDTGNVNFDSSNWSYDSSTGKITINVSNEQDGYANYTFGDDEYVIVYRFEDYTEDITSKLDKDIVVTCEEYSAKENHSLTKNISEHQEVEVNVGELITYNINSNTDRIQKSTIYANYNSEEALYETEFTSNVSVNILTSDLLEQLKIDCSTEYYIDNNGYKFTADEVTYKGIKFNYTDVKNILSEGGSIEIQNTNGEVLYVLTNELVNSEIDCEISINYESGIYVFVKNIQSNGVFNFEVTKVIKKCSYEKNAFKNFVSIESDITAEVKYANIDQTLSLDKISTTKDFNEAYTRANIYMNKDYLSTIKSNDNVEIKIELNNDKEDSDLYVNPSFELVFPSYVTNVTVESINLLYDNGLALSDFETYTESDIVKMRIEFTGTQKTFSESTLTNGTNIIINVDIDVDEYAPSKEDQIKMYYCNEGVSNYESQTKWTISKQIPNGILKTTNGFDVVLFNYQAPSGLVTANAIVNYDGNLSELNSVKQGTVTTDVEINSGSRITTMKLVALNNTGNECSDVEFLGRIPFKGNTDVISGEDLGTTVTASMVEFISEDIQNNNMVEVYYSTNEKATKDLSLASNDWRTAENINISEVRSYLIVVKGNMASGSVLRFTYDFEIPANLAYETSIYGSFGAYYNNISDVAIVYESSKADLVGVTTEAGPKIEARMTVDVGDGTDVGEYRYLTYTLEVENVGSITVKDVNVQVDVPDYAFACTESSNNGYGNNQYLVASNNYYEWNFDEINPEENYISTMVLKTSSVPTQEEYTAKVLGQTLYEDEDGYYYIDYVELIDEYMVDTDGTYTIYDEETDTFKVVDKDEVIKEEKVYVELEEVPDIYITMKAEVTTTSLGVSIESNETKNKLVESKFDFVVNTETPSPIYVGNSSRYMANVKNVSGETLNNVTAVWTIPETVNFVTDSGANDGWIYDDSTRTATKVYETIEAEESIDASLKFLVVSGNSTALTNYLTLTTEDGVTEKSSDITRTYSASDISITQTTNRTDGTVLEGEDVEFIVQITNTGNAIGSNLALSDVVSNNLNNVEVSLSGSVSTTLSVNNGVVDYTITTLPVGETVVLKISGQAASLNGETKSISNVAEVVYNVEDVATTGTMEIAIKENLSSVTSDNTSSTSDTNDSGSNGTVYSTDGTVVDTGTSEDSSNSSTTTDTSNSNNSTNTTTDTTDTTVADTPTYSISGKVWLDENEDGRMDDEESKITAIVVQLYKNNNTLRSTMTDGNGEYSFTDLEEGTYTITFEFDSNVYGVTGYQRANVEDYLNSDAIETSAGNAVTDTITLSGGDVENINLGLLKLDTFDLQVEKVVTNTKVTTSSGKEETAEFDDITFGKVEIKAKELEGATVDITYKIKVTNVGDLEGTVTSIEDTLSDEFIFNEDVNEGWVLGTDGTLYNYSLKDEVIAVGETKELTLVLTKVMTEDNTGGIENIVYLASTENADYVETELDNNVSKQVMMILVKTGGLTNVQVIVLIGAIAAFIAIMYFERKNIMAKVHKENVYKNKVKSKLFSKKNYK